MQHPLQITFRGMQTSPAVESHIRDRAAALEHVCQEIIGCRVAVEATTRRGRQGHLYRVRVDLTVPGEEIVAGRSPEAHHAHEEIMVALRDAFDAIRRQLEDYARKRRGAVKTHEAPAGGQL